MKGCIVFLCVITIEALTPFVRSRQESNHKNQVPKANASSLTVNSRGGLLSATPHLPLVLANMSAQEEDAKVSQPFFEDAPRPVWHRAIQGGVAGLAAGLLQVLCLMWLRTAMTHQYYHGGSLAETFDILWAEGGISRFYQGLGFALLQKPLARFGDAFMQSAALSLFGEPGKQLHGFTFGFFVATFGAMWRLGTAPLDTWKTAAQVHGSLSHRIFAQRFRVSGLLELWSGAMATFVLILSSSLPWWTVYNSILEYWPRSSSANMHLLRNCVAGICASLAADIISNSFRVLKVKRQATTKGSLGMEGYIGDARDVVSKDGLAGLFCRGLCTRVLCGAINGAFFSVTWSLLLQQ